MEEGETAKLVTMERVAFALDVSLQEMILRAFPGDPAEDARSLARIFDVEVQEETALVARLSLVEAELREARGALEARERLARDEARLTEALVTARKSVGELQELEAALAAVHDELEQAKRLDAGRLQSRALLENPGLAEAVLEARAGRGEAS